MEFDFVTENVALDFVATVACRDSRPRDFLTSAAEVTDWIRLAGLSHEPIHLDDEELRQVIELREAVYALLRRRGRAPTGDAAVGLINRRARSAPPSPQITDHGRMLAADLDAALAAIARAAVDAYYDPRLKWCEADRCTRPFLDRSRGGTRRWCGMASCGAREKAARYRARKRRVTIRP